MLKIKNLNKTFNQGTVNEKAAMRDVNLHLKPGDFVTIIGSNGAGKSTLFNLIGGSFLADTGSIILGDKDITFMKEHKRAKNIGRLFQDPLKGSAPSMTIEENLILSYLRTTNKKISFSVTKQEKEFFRERVAELGLGLEDRMKTKMGLMSTLVTPQLLLLDEHTAALDPGTAEKVLKITRDIVKENKITTMMITHNIHSALELGNRTIMMDNGRIVLDIEGEERTHVTVPQLLDMFKEKSKKELDNDRILLA